ncbi:aminomethyl-transferring glycine dehydrogenase subunit GcvPA [Vagococcus sp. BWB3-3]|uniref:Aminomethyl-transferring glycine dehydrogenase subunit GcvPA n=1 Tax=Vagococcus allomyrinae TaxID=2794353 RepID=A0A940PGU1_9ENTE|nr:aminomethyl-transferring glycine dehydrogenase subunit GcvPA [Vagococcus allomyrinae]MBP1044589.1 aminomethyl-transferring glycine dehydrogenase subunit GcvPA [Vagococcus allomyrinae]
MSENKIVYPYIPNSNPETQKEMMDYVGVKDMWELYEEIPEDLLYRDRLAIPDGILDEFSIKKHVEKILAKNTNCDEFINFLGAGCAQHFIPAVVDEITTRGEFLTCYGAESWADHGKYQAFVEYNSMLAELLETEVMSVPQFDGGQAMSTALAMACRMTDRRKVLLPELMNPMYRSIVANYMDSVQDELNVECLFIKFDPQSGKLDLADLGEKLDETVAAVLIENPGFLGVLEDQGSQIAELTKEVGAEFIVYVNPISLGVLEAPANYGATITCGDLHSLGLHLSGGNGQAGFISTQGEARYLNNYKDFIYGFAEPEVAGEYVFGNMLIDRTHYSKRAFGKEFTGTGTNLWMISAAVYMALMGPKGMEDVGTAILYNSQYAAQEMAGIEGVSLRFNSPFFQEFVVDFSATGKTVAEINDKLLKQGIFGGLDLSSCFGEFADCALYCVTEVLTKAEIDQLVVQLRKIVEN